MSSPKIIDEIIDEPQPTIDPALNIEPHHQSPTPASKYETINSLHSSPKSTHEDKPNDNFQDVNPLIQSTQHELRPLLVAHQMNANHQQQTPELNSGSTIQTTTLSRQYTVQSAYLPEKVENSGLSRNASAAEVTDYLRGLQSKLDTILKSSVVLHPSPLTSPVRSHSTFSTKERVDAMYSPSNDMFKYSNNFADFRTQPERNHSAYASVNNDVPARFFSTTEAAKRNAPISNRYENIHSSMVHQNGSLAPMTSNIPASNAESRVFVSQTFNRTVDIGSPLTSISPYIPSHTTAPVNQSQYSSIPRDRNQHLIETMKSNESKLDRIIENMRLKNAGGSTAITKTVDSRVTTIASPQMYNSNVSLKSPQSMTRKTEYYSQPVETLKKSNFINEYSSIQSRKPHDRQASISQSFWLDNQEKSRYLGASTISNTHVPLKLRADRNNPNDQSDREIHKEEGHERIHRYYIPDPTVKERDTKDHHDVRVEQSRPPQFIAGGSGMNRRVYRNTQQHLEVVEDNSGFHCQELEDDDDDDNQSQFGGTQQQQQQKHHEPVQVNHEEFIYGGSATFNNKKRGQNKVEKAQIVVTQKNKEMVSQIVNKREPSSSGVERSQPNSSVNKFFEQESEIDDFVFE